MQAATTRPLRPRPTSARTRRAPAPPTALRVVVTGGSRGLGAAMVDQLLAAGDDVVWCSRSVDEQEGARAVAPGQVALAVAADVGVPGDAARLAATALTAFGGALPHAWINNAGVAVFAPVADAEETDIVRVVATNVAGSLLGTRAALRLVKEAEADAASPPHALHIFNMDGAGSDGGPTPGFASYGATKAALTQLHRSLRAEVAADPELSGKAAVHRLSPGMMLTDLLLQERALARSRARWFVNALAEPAEDSAAFLVLRVRQVAAGPATSGPETAPTATFLTRGKALAQIAAKALFGARKGKWVSEDEE